MLGDDTGRDLDRKLGDGTLTADHESDLDLPHEPAEVGDVIRTEGSDRGEPGRDDPGPSEDLVNPDASDRIGMDHQVSAVRILRIFRVLVLYPGHPGIKEGTVHEIIHHYQVSDTDGGGGRCLADIMQDIGAD